MSTNKEYSFAEVMSALRDLRRQYEDGKPLVWNGPDELHYSVAATSMPPSWHFTDEGLDNTLENDLDFWDVYTMIAFQIGYSNGMVRGDKSVEIYKQSADTYRAMFENAKEILNEQGKG